MRRIASIATLIVTALLAAGCTGPDGGSNPGTTTPGANAALPVTLAWAPAIDLKSNGYEPGIAVDSTGILYMTAHKELNRPETWPYPASWMLMSRDGGKSWGSLASPAQVHEKYVGDEGDIAIDGRDWVYFIDTYLGDNHLHAWSNHGQNWEYSIEQHSTAADDRPWLAAQGEGVLHYLGNNGNEVNGGRYWYYRSTDGGLTWTTGLPVLGNGWATIEAERGGAYAYIVTEEDASQGDLKVMVSDDQGATWGPQEVVAKRGAGLRYPVVDVDDAGNVYVLYGEEGTNGTTEVHLSVSTDHGKTWKTQDITPFKGYLDYPWVNAGPAGVVGVAFYATKDLPLSASSKWFLYGGLAVGADGNASFTTAGRTFEPTVDASGFPVFDFSIGDPTPAYVGANREALHDFFEVAVGPDGALNVAYMHSPVYVESGGEATQTNRLLYFARGLPSLA